MTRPLVSVIVPSYNQGRFIRETLDSILGQDYRPLEVLVIDGASKDETVDVLRSYGGRPELQWISEPDRGVVDAVNKGLARAKGEIIAIQSSDDCFTPGAITTAVQAFAPGVVMVIGEVEYINAESRHIGETKLPSFSIEAYLAKRTFVPQPAAFFTREAAQRAGGWQPDVSYAADADYYLRIAALGRVTKLDAVLGRYRYHEEQRERAGERIARDWETAVRRWLEETSAPRRLRRLASLGIHLTHAHYTGDARWWRRTVKLYRALAVSPSVVFQPDFPRREIVPGRTPIWRFLSRVKQRLRRARHRAGALVYDYPRYREVVRSGAWRLMHNRDEKITTDGRGVRCEWEFTSDLHIAKVFPTAGARLMRMALTEWPVAMLDVPPDPSETPAVSFVIGHRGLTRLPHLLATLKSIAGQSGVPFECVVVEQDRTRLIQSRLPPWVRYRFSRCDTDYNRSATLNEGVEAARGEIVVLHDGDTLVPARYAAEVLARAREGFEFIDIKRFTFYLNPEDTKRVFETSVVTPVAATVTQNGKGVSIAASRRAYLGIGGFDEEFVGWGGEDNDFWDRVHAQGNAYEFGYLPMIHLHHEAQKGKSDASASGMRRYHDEIRSVPPEERIRRLLARRSRAPH